MTRLPSSVRRWLERAAIVAAALAIIATSPRRWRLAATSLPPRDPDHATHLIIEASEQSDITIHDRTSQRYLYPIRSPGPVRSEYFVPRGATIDEISIRGICHERMCLGGSNPCEIPKNAYVRVVSNAPVGSWHSDADAAPTTTVVDPAALPPRYRVVVRATSRTTLQVDAGNAAVPEIVGPFGDEFEVTWPTAGLARPVTITWTARAMIEGPCPTIEPCEPPATEQVEIRSISRALDDGR
jgi:hypothetical protein